ncbi:MAG: 50S ribosomal protein L6 [Fidelibacterota bacterium]|nr:MAG: 50S ribosomal protein L6 [Candidatus Neomarinimicrobiota bacterium]
MSHIGKQPIPLSEEVTVKISGRAVTVQGPKGNLSYTYQEGISVAKQDNELVVTRASDEKRHRALHGLTRVLLANMVKGVSEGFSKQLDLVGIGYTVEQKGPNVLLSLGFSCMIYFQAPPGIELEVINRNTSVVVKGIDRQLVGQVAAKIRSLRKPEPYKGKGVRYHDEIVRRKAGKTVSAKASTL